MKRTFLGASLVALLAVAAGVWAAAVPKLLAGHSVLTIVGFALAAVAAFLAARRLGLDDAAAALAAAPLALSSAFLDALAEPEGARWSLAVAAALTTLAAPAEGALSFAAEAAAVVAILIASPLGILAAVTLLARRILDGDARRRVALAVGLLLPAYADAAFRGGARQWVNLGAFPQLGAGVVNLIRAAWPPAMHLRIALLSSHTPQLLTPLGWLLGVLVFIIVLRHRRGDGDPLSRSLALAAALVAAAVLATGATAPGAAILGVSAAASLLLGGAMSRLRASEPRRVHALGVLGVGLAAAALFTAAPRRSAALGSEQALVADVLDGDIRAVEPILRLARSAESRTLPVLDDCARRSAACQRARGDYLASRDKWQQALPDLYAASGFGIDDPGLWFAIARADYELGANPLAVDALMRGLARRDDADAHVTYAQVLLAQGQRPRAVAQVAHAQALDPSSWRAKLVRGQLAQLDGDDYLARQLFLEVLSHAPENLTLRKNLFASCVRLGALAEASHQLDEIERRAPNDPEVKKMRELLTKH